MKQNKRMTAVEYAKQSLEQLADGIINGDVSCEIEIEKLTKQIWEQAKQMEKQSLKDFFRIGLSEAYMNYPHTNTFEEHYQIWLLLFGLKSNGSDGSGVLKEEGGAVSSGSGVVTSSQTEMVS